MTVNETGECPDCKAPMREHEQGFCPHEIETGERIVRSELTDTLYRTTKWVDQGDGKIITLHKEEIDEDEIVTDGGTDRSPYECSCCGARVDIAGDVCEHCYVNCTRGEHRA